MQQRSIETKRKILTACVRLFLEQGYKNTTVSQIVDTAGVARGSFQNLFPAKEDILLELIETMFESQFAMASKITQQELSPVCVYAAETAIQLMLTELNENLRDIYIEAYTLPNTSECIYKKTTKELVNLFGSYLPNYTECDFYKMEVGTAGLMRNYMTKKCDDNFTFTEKLNCFLTSSLRIYAVPEKEIAEAIAFIEELDIKLAATQVMNKLFSMLEMKYNFKLQESYLEK